MVTHKNHTHAYVDYRENQLSPKDGPKKYLVRPPDYHTSEFN